MQWWAWVVGGAVLLGAELGFVDAQFYLVFLGGAAVVVGLLAATVPAIADWVQWSAFAVLAVGSMVGFRSRVYAVVRGHLPAVGTGPIGGTLTLAEGLAPGQTCQAEHGGSFWSVRNAGTAALPAGARVRIVAVDGLTLKVRAEKEPA